MIRSLAAIVVLALPLCAGPFRTGAAAVDISPPTGAGLPASGIHDPIYAKALVFEQDGEETALVVLDMAVVRRPLVEDARRRIREQSHIEPSHVVVSATHAHTAFTPGELGPVIPDGAPAEVIRSYSNELAGKIADAVARAKAALKPVRVKAARVNEDHLVFNRRFLMKDGSARMNPGFRNPAIVRPLGPVDPTVNVVYFEALDGNPVATLVNYALHLDTTGGKQVSADYPATLAKILRDVKGPDMVTVFSIGAAGNINHFDVSRPGPQKGYGEAARIGTILAGAVLKAYKQLEELPTGPPKMSVKTVLLPPPAIAPGDVEKARAMHARMSSPNPPTFLEQMWLQRVLETSERGGPLEAEVQVLTIGSDLAWAALPGEIFTELGMAIRTASPFRYTLIHELAGDWIRYVPDRKNHAYGAYEAINTRGAPGSGELMVNAAVDMLVRAGVVKTAYK